MWDTVGNIAAVIVIILLFELLGLPDWIRRAFRRKEEASSLRERLDRLEERVRALEGER
jgi:hypothetical protein